MSSLLSRLFAGATDINPAVYEAPGTITERISELDVMRIPMVVTCRQLIADTVASFPLHVYDEQTGRKLDRNRAVLRRPNPEEPYSDTIERLVNAMTRYGTAWMAETVEGSDGYPLAVEHVANRRVNYTLNDAQTRIASLTIDGRPAKVSKVHTVPFILEDTPIGTSPLIQIRDVLESLNAAYVYASDYYGAGAVPPYALIHPTRLQADKAEELWQSWAAARDKRRPAVLSGDLSLQTYTPQSAADALVLDAQAQMSATIAAAMQIPPSLVNALSQSSLTYSTVRDEFRRWLVIGLNTGYLGRLESAFTELLPRGQVARFDTTSLTRLDEGERIDLYERALAAGIYTLDEVRAREGLEPSPMQETANVAT